MYLAPKILTGQEFGSNIVKKVSEGDKLDKSNITTWKQGDD